MDEPRLVPAYVPVGPAFAVNTVTRSSAAVQLATDSQNNLLVAWENTDGLDTITGFDTSSQQVMIIP